MRLTSENRTEQLKVCVSPAEKAELDERARATGLTVSTYLCKVEVGFSPPSHVDGDALQDLSRVSADW